MRAISFATTARLLFGQIDTMDHRRRRLLGIVQGLVTSLGNRAVGIVVSFVSVPLTIGYLGPERYGAWVTIVSMLAWTQLTDFGLGNGLSNAVTTAVGQDRPDLVRLHLSNGMVLLGGIAAIVGLLGFIAWPFVDWVSLFGVHDPVAQAEVGPALGLAFGFMLLQFPLACAGKLYVAHQEGRIGNYWGMAGSAVSLVALLVVTRTQGGLVWLVLALMGTSFLMSVANNLWTFGVYRPTLAPRLSAVDLRAVRPLINVGGQFFLLQVMALVTFQTDNIVISHFLGADQVPRYSLAYTLFSYTSLMQSMLFSYLWSAYNEAIARHDIDWVRRTFRLNLGVGMAVTSAAVIALAFIAQPFIGWWAGEAVIPSLTLIGWMAGWSLINAFTNPIACLLAAASHLRWQIVYGAAAATANVVLSLTLVRVWGAEGVIAGTVIAYGVFVCGPTYLDSRHLLRRLERTAARPLTA